MAAINFTEQAAAAGFEVLGGFGKDYCAAWLAALVAALGNIPSPVGPLPIVPAFIFPFPLYSL